METDIRFSDETDAIVCVVCGNYDDVGIRPIMCDDPICGVCMRLWYNGCMDPVAMRRDSLKLQGRSHSAEAKL